MTIQKVTMTFWSRGLVVILISLIRFVGLERKRLSRHRLLVLFPLLHESFRYCLAKLQMQYLEHRFKNILPLIFPFSFPIFLLVFGLSAEVLRRYFPNILNLDFDIFMIDVFAFWDLQKTDLLLSISSNYFWIFLIKN